LGCTKKLKRSDSKSLLMQNVTGNHRVNDIIATEEGPQTLVGRFMYGPLDMVTLTGEKVTTQHKTLHLSARGLTAVPGSNLGCITSGRDWESHRAAHNWPSVARVWPG
jgi:hypothetical protein